MTHGHDCVILSQLIISNTKHQTVVPIPMLPRHGLPRWALAVPENRCMSGGWAPTGMEREGQALQDGRVMSHSESGVASASITVLY